MVFRLSFCFIFGGRSRNVRKNSLDVRSSFLGSFSLSLRFRSDVVLYAFFFLLSRERA